MMKKLLNLPYNVLAKIGSDYSFFGPKKELARRLTEYFKSYGLTWEDISHRYNLKDHSNK